MTGGQMTTGLQGFATAADGLRLGYVDYRPRDMDEALRPLVCLPGLTRNARDFHPLALLFANTHRRRVISIDYRGRGSSERASDPASYTVPIEARDVLTVLDDLAIGQADFIGTSRGGLILHILAATAPDRLGAVIFNDIGPELGVEGLRLIQASLATAGDLLSWDAVVDRLRSVHGSAFPLLTADDWAMMARALYRQEGGRFVADCDPAIGAALAAMDLASPPPSLWQMFDQFPDIPMMVVRGETSKLLTTGTVAEMQNRRPALVAVTAEGQGHAPLLHLADLPQAIEAFLRRG